MRFHPAQQSSAEGYSLIFNERLICCAGAGSGPLLTSPSFAPSLQVVLANTDTDAERPDAALPHQRETFGMCKGGFQFLDSGGIPNYPYSRGGSWVNRLSGCRQLDGGRDNLEKAMTEQEELEPKATEAGHDCPIKDASR